MNPADVVTDDDVLARVHETSQAGLRWKRNVVALEFSPRVLEGFMLAWHAGFIQDDAFTVLKPLWSQIESAYNRVAFAN